MGFDCIVGRAATLHIIMAAEGEECVHLTGFASLPLSNASFVVPNCGLAIAV